MSPIGLGNLQGDFNSTGIVVFDYGLWITRYPELIEVNEALAGAYWEEAGLYLNNTRGSIVQGCAARQLLLNMLTAHIAKLNATIGGQAPSDLVGRISSATQGAVSVSTDGGCIPGSAGWFAQTRYGIAYWQATAQYRMMRYFPGSDNPRRLARRFGVYGNVY